MDRVFVGLNVDIKRTDRRIHPAKISCLNTLNRTVTVEWLENGETKAKEIEIEIILALNPHLITGSSDGTPNHPTTKSTPKNVSRRATTGSKNAAVSNLRESHTPQGGIKSNSTPKLAVAPSSGENLSPGLPNFHTRAQPTVTNSMTTRRRTNPIKEVERLEKNREERKIRNAESREEKKTMMKKDPGNVNWEFSAMIKEFCASLDYHPIRDTDFLDIGNSDPQITVCVRKRPMNKKETDLKEVDIVSIPDKQRIIVHEPKLKVDLTKFLENQLFRYDYAFDENCNNEIVYRCTARPLVRTLFEGGMATCFAYGQTGSGKTHTMGGEFLGKNQNCGNGIYVLTATDVFKNVQQPKYRDLNLKVSASFFEIYSGKVFDLLNGKAKLRVLEDGKQQVQVVGLSERTVESVDQVLDLIRHGSRMRTSGQTAANANSSRSHAVFQIILRTGAASRLYGKFSLVDLAGNERGADTNSSDRQTRMEGSEINKSLLALKECIRALGRRGAHLPFRASKLTQVLKDSFIGEKSKTCMIAMISPGMSSCENSLNTLRYADRVKELAVDVSDPSENEPNLLKSSPSFSEPNLQLIMEEEEELSAELYSFHEAAFRLQEMEEDVVESHRNLLESFPKWHQTIAKLIELPDQLDFDLEAYVSKMSTVLTEFGDDVMSLKTKFIQARKELEEDDVDNLRPKMLRHPRSMAYKGNQLREAERCE
ncbi:kinesin-like protein KIF2A isoform X1 [Daphnia pulicaria]|uniref:kinesin-like protein KIF2A isoform X1 n=1 Tax=Daphnia pulicaria TaxID=35523 RepID=UPI001EEC04BF|nr:kinesin-like protein KIF2A isoform X1 [Daphnia pulicaria]